MSDRIERTVVIAAPPERVWEAISDHRQFGAWFRVALDQPFVPNMPSTGRMTVPGYEHVRWAADVVAVEPPSRLAFRWHPYAIDPNVDYSGEPTTLVEFLLAADEAGTRVTVLESGFDAIPPHRRDEAFRMNGRGWDQQVQNVKTYVEG